MSFDLQLTLELIAEDLPAAERQARSLSLELIRPQPEAVDLFMPYRAPDERDFMLRLRCDGYDDLPPSFQFVNPEDSERAGPEWWPRMEAISYARSEAGEVVYCTPGVREYHQHPSHRGESHSKSTWRLAAVVVLAWRYLFRSGRYLGGGV